MKPLLPFVPTPDEKLPIIVRFAEIKPGQKSVDLGSGDGKLVICMAKLGAIAYGFEIQQKYVRRAKTKIMHEGLQGKAFVSQEDFWTINLHKFEVITIYGMAAIMDRLSKKLSNELAPGTKVISNGFPLPGWKHQQVQDHVYLYIKSE